MASSELTAQERVLDTAARRPLSASRVSAANLIRSRAAASRGQRLTRFLSSLRFSARGRGDLTHGRRRAHEAGQASPGPIPSAAFRNATSHAFLRMLLQRVKWGLAK